MIEERAEPVRGRGHAVNPPNRFHRIRVEEDPDAEIPEEEKPSPRTELLPDSTRTIIATNESPDVGFEASVNPYRGCEHGCAYCYARPTHEFLGLSAGLDFETKILVKEDVPRLLREALASPRFEPKVLAMSGVTDPYQPVERRLRITRGCLEALAEFCNPVCVITKNFLVTRDIDLLSDLAKRRAAAVLVSITTLDERLRAALEPRTSTAARRLAAIEAIAAAGIPAGVMVAPVIPGLTDHEMPRILAAAARAGASFAGFTPLRLPFAVAPLFEKWLSDHAPLKKDKVLARIREIRGGRLNDPGFGSRMRGTGEYAETLSGLFEMARRKAGIPARLPSLSAASFRRPGEGLQRRLFE